MLRTGEDESRPPKREQGSLETTPAAEAELPLPRGRSSRQPVPLGRGESGVQRCCQPDCGVPTGCHPRSTLLGSVNAAGSACTWIQTCERASPGTHVHPPGSSLELGVPQSCQEPDAGA